MLETIANDIVKHGVKLLMMDANMAELVVVEKLRSRGVLVDVCAWLPWMTLDGQKGMDSCFIALIDCPGSHLLNFAKNSDSPDPPCPWDPGRHLQLPCWVKNNQVQNNPNVGFNGGYGQLLTAYLPKNRAAFDRCLAEFLRPSAVADSQVMYDKIFKAGRTVEQRGLNLHDATGYATDRLRTHEKRLDLDRLQFEGQWPASAHYPLCMMTRMASHRSEHREEARNNRNKGKKGKWYPARDVRASKGTVRAAAPSSAVADQQPPQLTPAAWGQGWPLPASQASHYFDTRQAGHQPTHVGRTQRYGDQAAGVSHL